MSKFNPEKLSVEFRDGFTATNPVIPRRYTLTHSDSTGELFLTVGMNYAWDKVDRLMRDEVLSEWVQIGNMVYFVVYVYIDGGQFSEDVAGKRNEIFRRELPLALNAIRYGDRALFDAYPFLKQAGIIVNFQSSYPQFAKQEYWGTFYGVFFMFRFADTEDFSPSPNQISSSKQYFSPSHILINR